MTNRTMMQRHRWLFAAVLAVCCFSIIPAGLELGKTYWPWPHAVLAAILGGLSGLLAVTLTSAIGTYLESR